MRQIGILMVSLLGLWSVGCEADDPSVDGDADGDVDVDGDADADGDADGDVDGDVDGDEDGEVEPCQPLESDYMPRDEGSAHDSWPVCISDDNSYHLVDTTPSSIARVGAFEEIAALLFDTDELTAQDFIDARIIYTTEQGLESRVVRREDEHYPPAVDGDGAEASCRDAGIPEIAANYDRCVGPAQIMPILNDAFADGITGNDLQLNAARVEGALLWFLFVSSYKEAVTCETTAKDCDSSWAYYGGGSESRTEGLGLSRYARAVDVEADDRTWDGVYAVRCWRDLLDRDEIGTGETERDLAWAQLDAALIRGLASIVSDRTAEVEAATGVARDAGWIVVQILGDVLDREATARDVEAAADLAEELDFESADDADLPFIRSLLLELFPCP